MPEYYLGRDARITHEVFESRRPIDQMFLIADLQYVHTLRVGRLEAMGVSQQVGACSTGLTGVCAVLSTADNLLPVGRNGGLVSLALMAGAVLAAAVTGAYWSGRRRPLELRAIYRGQLVCVYESTDRLVFGQVTRALNRAIEARGQRVPAPA